AGRPIPIRGFEMPKGDPSLRALARSAANLNSISDELVVVLNEVEERLANSFSIPGSVEIKSEPWVDSSGSFQGQMTISVAFDRFNREWTLLLQRAWSDGDTNSEPLR